MVGLQTILTLADIFATHYLAGQKFTQCRERLDSVDNVALQRLKPIGALYKAVVLAAGREIECQTE